MAAWKQVLIAVLILVAAVGAWARFAPNAPAILAGWGMDWAQAATPKAGGTDAQKPARIATPVSVVTVAAGTATINDRLQAIGTGRAFATVSVTPYTSGRLTEFLVQSGAHIEAGQVIAKLDSDTEEIALDRAKASRDDLTAKVARFKALRASNAATNVQLTDAEFELRNGELSVHDAQVALDRRSITSQISGTVGILPIEAGNYVTSSSVIATVDDRSSILVDYYVPERFAAAVKVGAELTATPIANPNETYSGTVSAIDNHLDEKSRTLWVQAKIANPADSLRAGMSFQVTMKFPGETYPTISPLALQWGSDGAYVWTVDSGKAKRLPVRVIQRNTESVLVDAPISDGSLVVTEGVQSVNEGSPIRVAENDRPVASATAP